MVYGKDGGSADIDLATLTPAQGFKISASAGGDNAGYSVSMPVMSMGMASTT